jgi:hypothetical protein
MPPVPRIARSILAALGMYATATDAQTALPVIPELNGRLMQMRFFSSTSVTPGRNTRIYSTRFDAAATQYINVELEFVFPAPGRIVEFPVSCQYVKPDGGVLGPFELKFVVQPTWSNINNASGWGSTAGGVYTPGVYQAKCSTGTTTIAQSTFEVAAPAAEIANASAKFTTLRFFESPRPMLAIQDRKYAHSFEVATTRSIGVELTFKAPAPGRVVEFTVQCQMFKPDGAEFGKFDIAYAIQPDWTSIAHASTWGWETAGRWEKGVYRTSCSSGGNWIADGSFEIV